MNATEEYDFVAMSVGDVMPSEMARLTSWTPFDRRLGIRDAEFDRLRIQGWPCAIVVRAREMRYAVLWVPRGGVE